MNDPLTVADRLEAVRDRLAAACQRAGRPPDSVRIMAVTKTHPRVRVEEALAAGIALFGENRVQEAVSKYSGLAGEWELHLVGHLQRNKAAPAARLFTCVQSIDRAETAAALDQRCAEAGRAIEVLLECNTGREPSKSGVRDRDALLALLDAVQGLPRLRVGGLMTVGPLTDDAAAVRAAFRELARLFGEIRQTRGISGFATLSMGMSGDFETAVEEGATLVRLGTALFGPRPA